jgi:PAS domain S-box-containing protein
MTRKSQKKHDQGGSLKKGKDLNGERESETRYRELFELESDAVLLIDNETGNILEANHAAIALYGYSREELLAKKNTDLSDEPEQTKKITRQTAADKNRIVHVPIRYHRKKDGTVFPCEITARFFLHHGKSVHIAAIRDITERKRAEQALYSSQNMLQTVLDTIPAAVFWKDRDFRYLGGNRTWLDAVGIKSSAAVVGKSDYDLPWEQAQADSFREDDRKVMESGIPENNIIEPFLRADGTNAWARTNKVPLRDADGNVIGVLGTYEDITERKQMEEELYKAQKLESLGLLAGGIAHDFNNLLAGIFSHIDLARAASKDGVVSNHLSTALSAIDRARNLTGQLLTFAKGGAPVLETGDLSPVIRNASNLALSGSNVSCALNIPDGLWSCDFDKNQIGQVIDNMIINARAAMPAGGTILISAMNISLKAGEKGALQPENYVKISIHDDGTGIPEEVLPKIFDPFFTTKQKGNGLGLAICHSIVKRHGGWIDVESAPGKGTTFHIYLPASRKTSAMVSPQKQASFHRGSGRILIMDDEEIIRQSVGKILDTLGYSVECTRDGKETLAFLAEEIRAGRSFSAILLDLTVPGGMGGKEVALEIQKMNIKTPCFVTSGYSNDPVMSNPTNYGFTDSICKPFTIDDFAAMLNRYLPKNQ